MIFAQVKDGIVKNIVVLDDMGLAPLFSEGFDYFIRVDQIPNYPGPGDSYDGVNFARQPDPVINEQEEDDGN